MVLRSGVLTKKYLLSTSQFVSAYSLQQSSFANILKKIILKFAEVSRFSWQNTLMHLLWEKRRKTGHKN